MRFIIAGKCTCTWLCWECQGPRSTVQPKLSCAATAWLRARRFAYVKNEAKRRCGSYFARIASRRAAASLDKYGPLLEGMFSSFIWEPLLIGFSLPMISADQ